ncbi:MAG: MiaB/RimO family radical SAM methylthiotransferase, partial [Candidatus Hydrogenedentes bacterium]|nr:MiaB/RimO family radical SAM methylthiotransferase [Candidatus Hydrogenedentota bacterium]
KDAALPTRRQLDQKPYAFLKIADGCNHACTFCVIPAIKGAFQSRSREALLAEAQELVASGIREIDLVAQDITAYGHDLYPDYRIADLLRDLCAIPGDFWIRCLYCYPAGITDAFIEQLATQEKIVPYLDIPLQHVSPPILKAMRRPTPNQDITALIIKLRNTLPGLTVRTTMMVGFPGETEQDHQAMLDAVQKIGFEWLGAFTFCPEESTAAAAMKNAVPEEIAQERHETLMEIQAEITAGYNAHREGKRVRVLVEEYDDDLKAWTARSAAEAPEVDGAILIHPHPTIQQGEFLEVELLQASLYDITAQVIQ